MRNLKIFSAAAASLAALALGASAARADSMVSVTLANPATTVRAHECVKGCTLQVLYVVTNQGFDNIALTFTQHADPFSGDVENDVLKTGGFELAHPCGRSLAPITPCDVVADFIVLDADPDDAKEPDMDPRDFGAWLAGITVDWTFAPGVACPPLAKTCSGSTISPALVVDVLDDPATTPAPEPAVWGLLLVGLGSAGVRLRRRRATHTPGLSVSLRDDQA